MRYSFNCNNVRRHVNTKIKVNVNEDKENKDTCFSKKPFILSNKYFSIYGLYLRSTHYTYKYAFFFSLSFSFGYWRVHNSITFNNRYTDKQTKSEKEDKDKKTTKTKKKIEYKRGGYLFV